MPGWGPDCPGVALVALPGPLPGWVAGVALPRALGLGPLPCPALPGCRGPAGALPCLALPCRVAGLPGLVWGYPAGLPGCRVAPVLVDIVD